MKTRIPLQVTLFAEIADGAIQKEAHGWSVTVDNGSHITLFKFSESGIYAGVSVELFQIDLRQPKLTEEIQS